MTERLRAAAKTYRDALAATERAKKRLAEANEAVRMARPELADAIVDAVRQGVRQTEIVKISGYTRERVRQIVDAADAKTVE